MRLTYQDLSNANLSLQPEETHRFNEEHKGAKIMPTSATAYELSVRITCDTQFVEALVPLVEASRAVR